VAKATIKALSQLKIPQDVIAKRRGTAVGTGEAAAK